MTAAETYFSGERTQCSIGIAIAALSVFVSLYFLVQLKTQFAKGIAWPSIVIATLLLAICIGVVERTPRDIARVNGLVLHQQERIFTEEIPRMEKVMKSFRAIKLVEIIIFIAGGCMIAFAAKESMLSGIGMGLCIQMLILFLFDHVAEGRAKVYLAALAGM
jgi:hypothetical protein